MISDTIVIPAIVDRVYIADNGKSIKIGRSVNPKKRIRSIETQSGRGFLRYWSSPGLTDSFSFELFLHKRFHKKREIGEYFSVDFDAAVSFAESHVGEYLATQKWIEAKKQENERPNPVVKALNSHFFNKMLERAVFDQCVCLCVKQALIKYSYMALGVEIISLEDIPEKSFLDPTVRWLYGHYHLVSGVALVSLRDLSDFISRKDNKANAAAIVISEANKRTISGDDVDEIIGMAMHKRSPVMIA